MQRLRKRARQLVDIEHATLLQTLHWLVIMTQLADADDGLVFSTDVELNPKNTSPVSSPFMPEGDDSMHASCACSSHHALFGISNWLPSIVIQKEPVGLVADSLLHTSR